MPSAFVHMRPGDLITAHDINEVQTRIEALEARVLALEGTSTDAGGVVITDVLPTGDVKVGDELQVLGRNFGFSVGAHRVFVDGRRVDTYFPGSNDQQLRFPVPDIGVQTESGRPVTLLVSNQTSSAQRQITVVPAQPLGGGVDVELTEVAPATIQPNQPATLKFRLQSRANLSATYTITPTVTVSTNAQEWQSRLEVVDSTGQVIASRTIQLNAGEQKQFGIRINPVPATPGTFSLTVTANAGNVGGSSGVIDKPVGVPSEQPDSSIALQPQLLRFQDGSTTAFAGDNVSVPPTQNAQLQFSAVYSLAGVYAVTATVTPASSNWQVRVQAPANASETIQAQDLSNPQGRVSRALNLIVTAPAGAAASATLQLRVQRSGATSSQSKSIQLRLQS